MIVDLRMKTIAIIGASYLQRPLVERAKEMGLRTICFAWAEGAVCKDLCDVFYPISITEKEQILHICREEHIDGICTIGSDVAAPTVAYVAEQMGLTGNSYEAAVRAHEKHLMREAFMKAAIPCPHFMRVHRSGDDWMKGLAEHDHSRQFLIREDIVGNIAANAGDYRVDSIHYSATTSSFLIATLPR